MKIHEYYITQSKITSPGKYAYLYEQLPDTIPELCEIVQGLVMHFADEDIYNYKIPNKRYREMDTRHVEKILEIILNYDSSPLNMSREPKNRIIGACRDMAVLLCSILRYKKIPARLRVGFADYIIPGLYLDGMCVEYWNKNEEKWQYIDARVNKFVLEKLKLHLKFSLYDLPSGRFTTASDAWELCRENITNPNRFGSRQFRGLWYIRNCLMLDMASLNKYEVLIWDTWGMMLISNNKKNIIDETQFKFVDEFSQFVRENAYNIIELQKYYNENELIKVSKVLNVFNPFNREKIDIIEL